MPEARNVAQHAINGFKDGRARLRGRRLERWRSGSQTGCDVTSHLNLSYSELGARQDLKHPPESNALNEQHPPIGFAAAEPG